MRTMRDGMIRVARTIGKAGESPRRIYIARDDSARSDRQFFNLAEAEALLERHGFARVVISSLEVEQVATVFRDCEVVVGVHGAGLMNALLSAQNARLIELLDFPGSWNSIHMIVSACGLATDRVAALAPTGESQGLPLIDVAKLEMLLSKLG